MSSKRSQKPGLDAIASNGRAPIQATTSSHPTNAWSRPLQQKPARPTQPPPPGMAARAASEDVKAFAKSSNANKHSTSPSIPTILRERFLHLGLSLVGQKVVVTRTNGAVLEGIFHTSTPFSSLPPDMKNMYVLKACKMLKHPASLDVGPTVKEGSTVIFPADMVLYIHAKGINLDRPVNGGGSTPFISNNVSRIDSLRTDMEISGGRSRRNRDLVAAGSAWTATGGSGKSRGESTAPLEEKGGIQQRKGFGASSGSTLGLRGSIGEWDQFKANQELFNVSASFDENLYTTELDKSSMDARKIAEAERIAREIESTTSSNIHVAEERGHLLQGDYDEEDLYSGVLTSDGTPRHGASDDAPLKEFHEAPQDIAESKESSVKNSEGESSMQAPPQNPKKMNYAAAAAKQADASIKSAPPGFSSSSAPPANPTSADVEEPVSQESKPLADMESDSADLTELTDDIRKTDTQRVGGNASSESVVQLEGLSSSTVVEECQGSEVGGTANNDGQRMGQIDVSGDQKEKASPPAMKTSKLNAKAKSFTPSSDGQSQQVQPPADPGTTMHMPGSHTIQPLHYMHSTPMGQGLLPMMNPQFPVRYQPSYSGMEQHVSQLQPHQAQHVQVSGSGGTSGAASSAHVNSGADSSRQEGDTSQQVPPQQHQMPMAYSVPPPSAYFSGGMAMHPRGPGYPPQFVAGPQQVPGGTPYRQMYPIQPGGIPPNMHLRGPGVTPYYPGPNGPIPYPPGSYVGHGMLEDGDSGFRGRGRGPGGRGRRARGGRGRGPSRGSYSSYNPHGGRQAPQHHTHTGDSPPTGETSNPPTTDTG